MDHHDDAEGHHHHGHANDRGLSGALRYLRWAPRLWRSEISDAVVDLLGPTEGETVVDIGAGVGAGTVRAAATGASVIAVEPTPLLRRLLAVRCRIRGGGDITVVDGGAEHLPVDDHGADAVWATNTMHHWVDADRGVAEIARVLRTGGRAVLVDEDFDDPDHPDFERFGAARGGDDHHGFDLVDAAEMGRRLDRAGLVDIEAGPRLVAGRPVIAVMARAAPERSRSR